MSQLECDALRSYADGLLTDPEHPFVELLRSQGLVIGDAPVPHLAALLQAFSQATKVLTAWVVAPAGCRRSTFFVGPHSAAVSRCDEGGLYAGEDDLLSVWAIDSAQLREALDSLSEEHRMVVLMADVEGMSYKEIAEELGVPMGTVMSRLNRARKNLRSALADVAAEYGIGGAK